MKHKEQKSDHKDINTDGGDIVGGDKVVKAEGRSVAIGGDVSESTITTGDRDVDDSQEQYIIQIFKKIDERPDTSPEDKADLKAEVKDIQKEDTKGEKADESFIARRLRNIRRMAPDIFEVIVATIANPAAGFGVVARKVAVKAEAEAG